MTIHKEKLTLLFITLTLLLCTIHSITFASEQQMLSVQNYGHPDAAVDEYIVVFSATTRSKQAAVTSAKAGIIANGGVIKREFQTFSGFSARMNAETLQALRTNRNVETIEANLLVTADEIALDPPSWGLDRIDDRDLPLDNSYEYDGNGAGVTAYIIDSGIRASHEQFEGRVIDGFTSVNDGYGWSDCNSHGTHVAGTVAGKTVGVAPGANLVSVRVLDCNNSAFLDGIVAGIEWVTQNALHPAVANMSLSYGTTSITMDNVVRAMANSGVIVANSAGNRSGADACNFSPQPVDEIITVGSTDNNDNVSNFSNLGSCVDIFAPGRDIVSASNSDDSSLSTKLGTSMSTPHVAGCAARYISEFPSAISADVVNALTGGSSSDTDVAVGDSDTSENDNLGVVTGDVNEVSSILAAASENVISGNLNGAPNRLLYCKFTDSNSDGGITPTPTPTPIDENIVYSETFEIGNDWVVNPDNADTATSGAWEVGFSEPTYSESGLPFQARADEVLVTGKLAGTNVGAYDVDGGVTSVKSPLISVPDSSGAMLSLNYYMAHADNATNEDSLIIKVIGSSQSQIIVREFGSADEDYGEWRSAYVNLSRFEGDTIYLLITATDNGVPSLIEAAVDDIKITLPNDAPAGGGGTPTTPPSGNGISTGDEVYERGQIDETAVIPTAVLLLDQNTLSTLSFWIVLLIIPLGAITAVYKR